MDIAQLAADLDTALAAALPTRIVTRNFIDAPERDDADLAQGVVTILVLGADNLSGPPDLAEMTGQARLMLLGQIKVGEDSTGSAIEDAELTLFNELKAFAAEPGAGLCSFDLISVAFSAQLDHPYGWLRCEAVYAELD